MLVFYCSGLSTDVTPGGLLTCRVFVPYSTVSSPRVSAGLARVPHMVNECSKELSCGLGHLQKDATHFLTTEQSCHQRCERSHLPCPAIGAWDGDKFQELGSRSTTVHASTHTGVIRQRCSPTSSMQQCHLWLYLEPRRRSGCGSCLFSAEVQMETSGQAPKHFLHQAHLSCLVRLYPLF